MLAPVGHLMRCSFTGTRGGTLGEEAGIHGTTVPAVVVPCHLEHTGCAATPLTHKPSRNGRPGPSGPGLDELEQVGVDGLSLGGGHAVREAVVGLERPVLHELRGQRRGVGIRHDLVVVAVHD
jgi:hypothetical protein